MLKKIDQIQALLNVPNVNSNAETAIANIKILNILVDLRAEAEQLILSDVVDCKHDNEIMRQGNGFVYSTCGDCGYEL